VKSFQASASAQKFMLTKTATELSQLKSFIERIGKGLDNCLFNEHWSIMKISYFVSLLNFELKQNNIYFTKIKKTTDRT